MIKHCLGNSQINSIPAWSKEFSYINVSLQNTRKSLRVGVSRYYSLQREIKEIFGLKTHPFIN